MSQHATANRLVDAIERAKQEVFKSREVLHSHLSSVPPADGRQAAASPMPAAPMGQSPGLYGMGQPVGTPLTGLAWGGRSASASLNPSAAGSAAAAPAANRSASASAYLAPSVAEGSVAATPVEAPSAEAWKLQPSSSVVAAPPSLPRAEYSYSSVPSGAAATPAADHSPSQAQSLLEELLAAATPSPARPASTPPVPAAAAGAPAPAPAALSTRVTGANNSASEALANARSYLASLPPLAPAANPPIQYRSSSARAEPAAAEPAVASPPTPSPEPLGRTVLSMGGTSNADGEDSARDYAVPATPAPADEPALLMPEPAAAERRTLSAYHAAHIANVADVANVQDAVAALARQGGEVQPVVTPVKQQTPAAAAAAPRTGEDRAMLKEEVAALRRALELLEGEQARREEPASPPSTQQLERLQGELQQKRDELKALQQTAAAAAALRHELAGAKEDARRRGDEVAHWRRQAESFERELADARRQLAATKQDFAQQKAQLLLRYAEQQAAAQVPTTVYAARPEPEAAAGDAAAGGAEEAPAAGAAAVEEGDPTPRKTPPVRPSPRPTAKRQPSSFPCDNKAAGTPKGVGVPPVAKRAASRSRTPEPAHKRPPTTPAAARGAAGRSRTPDKPQEKPAPPAFREAPARSASPKVSTYLSANELGQGKEGEAAAAAAKPPASAARPGSFSRRPRSGTGASVGGGTTADDHPVVAEPATGTASVDPSTDPPPAKSAAMAQWKSMLTAQRKAAHPCTALPLPDVEAALDANVPPCTVLGGERREIAPGLFILHHASFAGDRAVMSFYNTLPDTQFNLRYTFSDAAGMERAHPDVVEQHPGDFGVSVYPGESKPFVTGLSKSSRMSLSFGPVENMDRHPRALDRDLRAEIEAVKQVLKGADVPRRATTHDILAACEKHHAKFVDPTFPPMPTSVARWGDAGGAALQKDVWAWRRVPTDARGDVTPELSPGELTARGVWEALHFAALTAPHVIKQAVVSATADAYRVLLRQSGWWHGVVVDNTFPVSTCGEPMYLHHRAVSEQKWPAAIEKALAKAKGGYAALHTLAVPEVLAAVMGAPMEPVALAPGKAAEVWPLLCAAGASGSARVMYATVSDVVDKATGLRPKRSFAVLAANTVAPLRGGDDSTDDAAASTRLVKIQPLSDGKWEGAWAPMSDTWTPEASVACGHDPSDGTQWIALEDLLAHFDALTVVDTAWCGYAQMNVAGHFDAGHPDTVVAIVNDGPPMEVEVGLYQKDAPVQETDPDAKRAGMVAGVLCQKRDDTAALVALTGSGVYTPAAAATCRVTVKTGAYFVVPQCAQPVDKGFVVGLRAECLEALQLSFVSRPKGSTKERVGVFPLPFSTFHPKAAHGVQGSRAYQVLRPTRAAKEDGDAPAAPGRQASRSAQSLVSTCSGGARKPDAAAPRLCSLAGGSGSTVRFAKLGKDGVVDDSAAVVVRKGGEKRAPSPQPPLKGALEKPTRPLEVVVVSANDLHLSGADPACYCEVKLVRLSDAGEWLSVPSTLKRTRYVPATSAPTWSTTITYPHVSRDDYLFLNCFDRDLFAQEEIGEMLLSLSEFFDTLTPGGPPSINWYQLQGQGATGCVQLSLSVPAPST
eukprot:TRINITY_DN3462_c0_g1_i1.p1 TRINITY_DN3462_c0_g1~~TRINITY_DN3462_c0_g1_i1.p1  ORF type:complete len:1605 (+),score=568.05 TRINITY_DN3462_c0_g1_i1:84-4898(+)